jgi:hypothetical protein
MPYDDMDRFVAFSKCLVGISADRAVDDGRYSDLVTKIITQMTKLLNKMDPSEPKGTGEDTVDYIARHSVTAAVPEISGATKKKGPPVYIRDQLVHMCLAALQDFERGITFETVPPTKLENLMQLANKAVQLHDAVKQYQQNRG